MKKLICLIVVLLVIPTIALSEPDLSGLTYDQLVAFQHYITMEIMQRPEWKEIEVPKGQWIVGVDIPAGTYCILSPKESCHLCVWGYEVKDYSTNGGLLYNDIIDEGSKIGKIKLKEGCVLDIDEDVIISPAIVLSF